MEEHYGDKIPLYILILNFTGTLSVALGLAEWLTDIPILPLSMQFSNYQAILIIAGILLSLPLLIFVMKPLFVRNSSSD